MRINYEEHPDLARFAERREIEQLEEQARRIQAEQQDAYEARLPR